jgi:hypothetical protein
MRATAKSNSWISPQIPQRSRIFDFGGMNRKSLRVATKPLLNARPVARQEKITSLIKCPNSLKEAPAL